MTSNNSSVIFAGGDPNGLRYISDWSAASGSFPVGATGGDLYKVSVAGTVDGVSFAVGDSLIAAAVNASTTTFLANWTKVPNAADVTSVHGRIGTVVAAEADYDIGEMGDVDLTTTPPAVDDTLKFDGTNWVPGQSSAGIADWASGLAYKDGQYVWAHAELYKASLDHTSAATFDVDLVANNWDPVSPTVRSWVPSQPVRQGDVQVVNMGGVSVYLAAVASRLTNATFDANEASEWQYIGQAGPGTYVVNQAVVSGFLFRHTDGTVYRRIASGTNAVSFTSLFEEDNWEVANSGSFRGPYSSSAAYKAGDVVVYQHDLYRSNFTRTAGSWGASPNIGDGADKFTRLGRIKTFSGDHAYAIGDVVYDAAGGNLGSVSGIYKITTAIAANAAPDFDNAVAIAVAPIYRGQYGAAKYLVGDVVEQAGKLYRCVVAHGSNGLAGPFTPANWVEVSAASASATLLDASAAALVETLPAATGSGATLKYAIANKTNSITFAVASGEYLNELLDSTYLASNHAVGAEFELVDYATGKWALAIVGAPTSLTLARYSVSGVATTSTVNGPNILPIGSLVNSDLLSSGMSIASEYDPLGWRAANQITVSKTGRYRVDLNVVHSTDNLTGVSGQDAVGVSRSGIRVNGTAIEWIGMDDTSGLADQMSGFVIRNFTAGDEIDVVVNATTVGANEDFYVSFAMDELPTTETILAGMVVPTPLVFSHARAAASQAVADSTNVLISLDTAVSDASGLFVSGTNRIVIATNGLYRIRGVVPWSSSGNPGIQSATILVNGVAIKSSSTRNNQPLAVTEVETTLLLVAGDYVQLRARQETGVALTTTIAATNLANVYPELEVRQLPLSTVVNPDTVPVEDLDYVSYASASIGGNIATELVGSYRLPLLDDADWTHKVDTNSLLTLAAPPVGDSFTIKKAGLYAVSVEMIANSYSEQTVYIFRNGIIVATGWANTGAGTSAMSQVGADITISLAVGDRIQFGSLIAAGWSASLSIRQLATKTVTYRDPAFTEAKDLHRVSLHSPNNYTPTTTPSIGGAAVAVVDLDNVTVTQVYNPNGMINTATNTINIQQAGAYSILFSGNDTTVENGPCVLLNGVVIGRSYSGNSPAAGEHDFAIELIKDLVIGDRLEFGFNTTPDNASNTLGGCSIVVTQLPSQEYVTPGDVPVTTLSKASINVIGPGVGNGALMSLTSTSGLANAPGTIMPTTARLNLTAAGWTSPTSQILVDTLTVGATDLTIVNTGLYRIHASATIAGVNASGIQIVRNGAVIAFGSMYAQATSGRGDPTATCVVNLTAGDVIDFRVANQNTAALTVELFSIDVVQLPGHSIVKYTPGDVIVENLHYLELNRSNVPTSGGAADFATGAVVGSGTGKWAQGASVGATANLTTGTITVAQSGTYVISTALNHYAAGGSATFAIRKNGTSILPIYVEGGDTAGSDDISWANQTIANLVAGDVIDLFCSSSGMTNRYFGAGSFISIRQMPTGLLVEPGTVPVNSLHYASIYGAMQSNVTAANGQTNVYNFSAGTVGSNVGSMINVVGNQIAIQQSGTYRLFLTAFDGTDACNTTIVKNSTTISGTSQFAGPDLKYPGVIDVIVPLVAGDILTFKDGFGTFNTQRGVHITVQQLPTATVIDPGTVPVVEWTNYTPTITGTTTNPTLATTNTLKASYSVIGKSMKINFLYFAAAGTGAVNGSGTYGFSIPAGYTIDTTKVNLPTTIAASAAGLDGSIVGTAQVRNTGTTLAGPAVMPISSTQLTIVDSGLQMVGSTVIGLTNANTYYRFSAEFPIL